MATQRRKLRKVRAHLARLVPWALIGATMAPPISILATWLVTSNGDRDGAADNVVLGRLHPTSPAVGGGERGAVKYFTAWLQERRMALTQVSLAAAEPRARPYLIAAGLIADENRDALNVLESNMAARFVATFSEEEHVMMGSEEDIVADDPRLIRYLKKRIPNAGLGIRRFWNSFTRSIQEKIETTFYGLNATNNGNDTSSADNEINDVILSRFFNNDFNGLTFVQVGGRSKAACWETQLRKAQLVQWTGLVVDMDFSSIEDTLSTRVAPFCVSPNTTPTTEIAKFWRSADSNETATSSAREHRVSYINLRTRIASTEQNFSNHNSSFVENNPVHSNQVRVRNTPYAATLVPLMRLNETLSKDRLGRYTHVVVMPVKCFPLYSIMLAAGLKGMDFLSIQAAGYSGRIAQSLPWDKINPLVIHLSDLGTDDAAKTLLESLGYNMVEDLPKLFKSEKQLRDFVFVKGY